MNPQEVNYWFTILADLLEKRPMHTTYGTRYDVVANEFELMGKDPKGTIQFKHSNTRNYVFIQNGELIVPRQNEAFLRGFFDK